jgi:hypothetical protein
VISALDSSEITQDELDEFERLDATSPLDEGGHPTWTFAGEPLTNREKRWLELFRKLQSHGLDSIRGLQMGSDRPPGSMKRP